VSGVVVFGVTFWYCAFNWEFLYVSSRRDGPLASWIVDDDRRAVEELVRQAKLMLDSERGCLAVICDDDDLGFVKSMVSSESPPMLHLHHSSMFAKMKHVDDPRYSPYHSVRSRISNCLIPTPFITL
jgi:hypothetical protein